MTEEQISLEMERNALISSVPELRKGAVEENTRPIRFLAEAFARRLGVPPEEDRVRVYAGAVVGGLITVAGPGPDDPHTAEEFRRRLEPALEILERTLVPLG